MIREIVDILAITNFSFRAIIITRIIDETIRITSPVIEAEINRYRTSQTIKMENENLI